MTLGLLGGFGCVPAFDNSFCGGTHDRSDTSASLRVKGGRGQVQLPSTVPRLTIPQLSPEWIASRVSQRMY